MVFPGVPIDLKESVVYELEAVGYLRSVLFNQSESPKGSLTVEWNGPEDGLKGHIVVGLEDSLSSEAVHSALSRLRPLAFGAAFKLNDMLVEWILRANGCTAWAFKEKLRSYRRLVNTRVMNEPDFLSQRPAVSQAFWEVYRCFVPYRNSVVHSGGVTLKIDGTIEIPHWSKPLLQLANAQQSSYVRAMCLLVNPHIGRFQINPYLEELLEADLSVLSSYHSVSGLRASRPRLEHLVVNVSTNQVQSRSPLTVTIDFDRLRGTMNDTYPTSPTGQLFYTVDLAVNSENRTSRWTLPVEAVPTGEVTLTEGDPAFDAFLSHVRE